MWANRFAKGALLAAAAVLVAVAPAWAAELVDDSFDTTIDGGGGFYVEGRSGYGWTQPDADAAAGQKEYAISAAGSQGILSFDLQRMVGNATGDTNVFSLIDASGEKLMFVQIDWESSIGPSGEPLIRLRGNTYQDNGLGLWSRLILLDSAIDEGAWVRFDFAWDDSAKRYELYINGKAQGTSARQYYNDGTGNYYPDSRFMVNEDTSPDRYPIRPFSYILSQAVALHIGSTANTASFPLIDSVIDNLVLNDRAPFGNLRARERNVSDLRAGYIGAGVQLNWSAPELYGINQGYVVYRRDGTEGNSRFEKLTNEPVRGLSFIDSTAVPSMGYRYSVASVYASPNGGLIESQYAPEVEVTAASVAIASVSVEKDKYPGGSELVATLRGTADCTASFSVSGVAADVAMTEVDDEVYVGSVVLPEGLDAVAAITASLTPVQGAAASAAGPSITIDSTAPDQPMNIIATGEQGDIAVGWTASASNDVVGYKIFRAQAAAPDLNGAAYDFEMGLDFVDVGVVPGVSYFYQVVPIDQAGNVGTPSDVVSAEALRGDGPVISGIVVDSGGKPARPGETVSITATGLSGGTATVSVDGIAASVALVEAGRTGSYTAAIEILPEHVQLETLPHAVVVNLCDAYGCSEMGGAEVLVIGENDLNDTEPPVIASASNDGFQAAGFSGKLVSGDVLTVSLEGEAGCLASFNINGVAEGAMDELQPGVYSGTYTVDDDDEGDDVAVSAILTDNAGNKTEAVAGNPVSFDTRVRIIVSAENAMLPADSNAKTKISAKAENANGDEISGQELQFTLSTTDEYTGVVGGGDIEGRRATKDDEDDIDVRWGGVTDAFGEVKATYTAGNAAKTALLVVKNLTTGDVGIGWLNTYIASSVSIKLVPRTSRNALDQAILTLTASPGALTADGRSKSRIKAVLKDLSNNVIAGQKVEFALAGENGKLRVLRSGTTDEDGVAEADYRAGTTKGTVTITASVPDYGVTAAVKIVLMSDAPANIDMVASATQLVADGKSAADIAVLVSDINNNPNEGAVVAFALTGPGSLDKDSLLTDRNGEGSVVYTAGTKGGVDAVIEARHTSRTPDVDELRRAYGTVFVPRLSDNQERDRIKIAKWLVDVKDEVEKGQPLVVLESRSGSWTLNSPATGVLAAKKRFKRDRVELGDSLGYVEIDNNVWEAEY